MKPHLSGFPAPVAPDTQRRQETAREKMEKFTSLSPLSRADKNPAVKCASAYKEVDDMQMSKLAPAPRADGKSDELAVKREIAPRLRSLRVSF